MSLLDFLNKKKEEPKFKGYSFNNSFTIDWNVSKDILFDFYKKNSYIKACINKIKSDVASFGVELLENGETIETDLLENLVNYQSRNIGIKKFIERIQRDVEICGNAYVYLSRNESDQVIGIQNLDPRYITPVVIDTGELLGYVQNLNGIRVFTKDEVFHYIEEQDINDETQGMSKMISLFVDLESDKEASESNLAFFKNNQTPSSIIVIDDGYDITDVNVLNSVKEIFNSGKYVGGKNHHRSGFIQGVKEIIKVQDKISDAEFIDLRKLTMQLVCAVYGVPQDLIGFTENSNRSVGDVQYEIYLNSIISKELSLQQFLNGIIKIALGQEYDLVILQDNLRQLLKKSEIAKKLYKDSGIITLNEARAIVQYDDIENGEKVYTDNGNEEEL